MLPVNVNGVIAGIFDDLPLRRAEVTSFLADWALENNMVLAERDLMQPHALSSIDAYRIIILPLGSETFDPSPKLDFVIAVTRLAPACPVVVLSDRVHQPDVFAAFQANAMGYVPSSLDPETALQALSLILKGGHYYPAGVL